MKQNITLSIDAELLKAAKVLAAKRHTSISGLLADELGEQVRRGREFQRARARALALLAEKLPLGGTPPARDSLHER